jgi:heparin binding hemagglutinin HbhA
MASAPQNTKSSEPTPLYALVGATDLAVESFRNALADAARRQAEFQAQFEHLQTELIKRRAEVRTELVKRRAEVQKLLGEPKRLQAELEQVPGLVFGHTMEAAVKAETYYEELAARGKTLVERLCTQKTTQDLVESGKATLNRTKAAVTTARQTAGDVATSAREVLTAGRHETTQIAETTMLDAEDVSSTENVSGDASGADTAVIPKATVTARKRIARTRPTAKSATVKNMTVPPRKQTTKNARNDVEAEREATEPSPEQDDE